jgi:hypothetical protein
MPSRSVHRVGLKHDASPNIACINKARIELGVDFDKLIAALQRFTNECFAPVWGVTANLVKATKPRPGHWHMTFWDSPDQPGAEGFHDITYRGLPLAKVYVKATLDNKDKVSTTACHELCEMLIDPAANLWAVGKRGIYWAYEVCDAVENEEFLLDGIYMSNFVYPAYFEAFRKRKSTQFDYMEKVTYPFQLLKGGYSQVFHGRRSKSIYFGSKTKALHFQNEDRRFHRSQFRVRRPHGM